MARLKLALPDFEPHFKTVIPLTINFVNYGGHMGNDAVLTLCHEARLRFLKDHNQSELDLFGKALIQGDAMVIYKSEAFQGDDLEIDIYIDDLSTYGFDFIYKITRVSDQVEIARAKTGMVFFDYESKKVTKIPVEFEKFSKI